MDHCERGYKFIDDNGRRHYVPAHSIERMTYEKSSDLSSSRFRFYFLSEGDITFTGPLADKLNQLVDEECFVWKNVTDLDQTPPGRMV